MIKKELLKLQLKFNNNGNEYGITFPDITDRNANPSFIRNNIKLAYMIDKEIIYDFDEAMDKYISNILLSNESPVRIIMIINGEVNF